MPADRRDLAMRLALATPADTVRGMFYRDAVAVVRAQAGEEAVAACTRGQPTTKWVDVFSYPVAPYLELACACVDALEPFTGSPEAALRRLGSGAIDIFFASAIGKTLLTLVGGNPRRLISNAAMAYRSAVSYGERTVTWTGERSAVVAFRRDFMPRWYQEGVLAAGIRHLGGKEVQVTSSQLGDLDVDYTVAWS